MAKTKEASRRRGRPRAAHLDKPDQPYTMKLPDGRTLFVGVPGRWVTEDRSGEVAFRPEAVRLLDRVRALAVGLDASRAVPSPGFISTLREALGMTQVELGEQVGVDKMTVSRWERGTIRPSEESLTALERLRRRAVRKGVIVPQ